MSGAGQPAAGFPVRWEDVRFGYTGEEVLHGVSLAVAAGESVALLGRNGAGKTTMTRLLTGLSRPRAGRVTVGEWDVSRRRAHEMARRVGYAFQHADQQLFARTVHDDTAFGPRQLGLGTGHVDDVLSELGLAAVRDRHPYDLPAPLRKLVTIAGVLAMRTGVLVLDEPTAGFDRGLRSRVIEALRRRLEAGVTVLLITHDLALVAALARREVVLEEGRITRDAPRS